MMSQVASLFQYYQKWVFEEKKLLEHSENSTKINISTIFKFCFLALRTKQKRFECIFFSKYANMKQKASTLNTSACNIGFAVKLVAQGNWFRRRTGFAGKLV